MTPARHLNWEQRLNSYFDATQQQAFVFGKSDCCFFAGNAIKAMTNHDLLAALPPYDSAKTSYAVMKKLLGDKDYRDHRNFLKRTLSLVLADYPSVSPHFLQRGDVALVQSTSANGNDGMPVVGVVDLSGMTIRILSLQGLAALPMTRALMGWRI